MKVKNKLFIFMAAILFFTFLPMLLLHFFEIKSYASHEKWADLFNDFHIFIIGGILQAAILMLWLSHIHKDESK